MGVAVGGMEVGVGAAVAAGLHPATQTITRQTNRKNRIVRFMVVLLLEQIITFITGLMGYNIFVITCQWFYNG